MATIRTVTGTTEFVIAGVSLVSGIKLNVTQYPDVKFRYYATPFNAVTDVAIGNTQVIDIYTTVTGAGNKTKDVNLEFLEPFSGDLKIKFTCVKTENVVERGV